MQKDLFDKTVYKTEIENFFSSFRSDDPKLRAEVIRILENNEFLVEEVMKWLFINKNLTIRWKIAEVLGDLKNLSEKIIPALIKTLSEKDDSLKCIAIKSLVKLGRYNDSVVMALVRALSDEQNTVQYKAVMALGEIENGNKTVIKALMEKVNNFSSSLRKNSLEALVKEVVEQLVILEQGLTSLIDISINEGVLFRKKAVQIFANIATKKDKAIGALKKLGLDKSSEVRKSALNKLNKLLTKSIENVNSTDISVRKDAVVMLGKLGNNTNEVIGALIKALSDNEEFIRYTAVESLEKLGNTSEEVIRGLVNALSDQDDFVKYIAARALGHLGVGSELAVTALTKMCDSSTVFVKTIAQETLLKFFPPSIVPISLNEEKNDSKKRKADSNNESPESKKNRVFMPDFSVSELERDQLLEIKIQTDQPPPHKKSPDYSKAILPKDVSDRPSQGVEQKGSTNKFNSEDRVKVGNQGEALLFNYLKANYQEIFRASLTKDTKNSFALERKFKLSIVKPTSLLEFHEQYQLWLANGAAAKGDTLLIFDPDKKIWQGFLRTIKKNKCEIIEANNAELNSININMEDDLNRVKIKIVDKKIFGKHTPRDYHLDVIWHNADVESYKSKDFTCIKTYADGQIKKRIFEVKTSAGNKPTQVKFSDKQLALMRKHDDNYWFFRVRGAEGSIDKVTVDKYKNPYKRIMGPDTQSNTEAVTAISSVKIYI